MMTRLYYLTFFLSFLFCQESYNTTLLGRWNEVIAGDGRGCYVENDTAYFAMGRSLKVVDFSNPDNSILLSELPIDIPIDMEVYSLAKKNNLLMIGSRDDLFIIDVSDINNLQILSELNFPEYSFVTDIKIENNFGYVSIRNLGLKIIDISNPEYPEIISTYQIADDNIHYGIDIINEILFISGRSFGLHILDISDPTSSFLISSFTEIPDVISVILEDNIGYIGTAGDESVFIVDFSDLENPEIMGACEPGLWGSKTYLYGDNLYIASGERIAIVNISDPNNPIPIYYNTDEMWHDQPFVEYDRLYLPVYKPYSSGKGGGMVVIDVSVPDNPMQISSYIADDFLTDVRAKNNKIFVKNNRKKIMILDEDNFELLGSYSYQNRKISDYEIINYSQLAVIERYNWGNYGQSENYLKLLDYSNPEEISQISSYSNYSSFFMDFNRNFFYLTGSSGSDYYIQGRFYIIEFLDSDVLAELGSIANGGWPEMNWYETMSYNENYAYIIDWDWDYDNPQQDLIEIVDVSDPDNPETVNHLELELEPRDVLAVDNYLIIAYENAIGLYLLIDPVNPIQVDLLETPGSIPYYSEYNYSHPTELLLKQENFIYFANGSGGLRIYNIVNNSLFEVGYYDTKGDAIGISTEGDKIYIADFDDGLYVIQNDIYYGNFELGDLNQDGNIDVLDVVLVVQIILGEEPTEWEMYAADLNQDGAINILDVIAIVNIILS